MSNKRKVIEQKTDLRIRFSEVDAMNVVWHGNYLKFFEDGREALGDEYGLCYLDFAEKEVFVPIVESSIKHLGIARYGDLLTLKTTLIDSPAAKIIHEYEVFNRTTGKVAAKGMTVQVFVNLDIELKLLAPDFYMAWKAKQNWTIEE